MKYKNNLSLPFTRILSVLALVSLLLASGAIAQKLPAKPGAWVEDYASILNSHEKQSINSLLRAYEDSTSNQIVVAIFNDAQGYPVEEFSIRLAEKWKVGQKGRDNGIILAIFLKEHKVRIEVGYGLEDKVPDATAFQIQQKVIVPAFRSGQYYQGIYQGCKYLMQAASGKFKGLPKNNRNRDRSIPWVFLIFLLIIFISIFRRPRGGTTFHSRGYTRTGPFFWGGGGFSGGGGGSFGGGGFSAGGGSFGGGGATSGW